MRFTLCAFPGRPVHSDTNSASPGSIPAREQLRAKAKSLTFPTLSIARYSFIQLSEQGRQWRERKCPIFETVTKRDSNPGLLDCESGILPLSYRAPFNSPFFAFVSFSWLSCCLFPVTTCTLILPSPVATYNAELKLPKWAHWRVKWAPGVQLWPPSTVVGGRHLCLECDDLQAYHFTHHY